MASTRLKNISQNGNLPQIGLKIKNLWNHHPVQIKLLYNRIFEGLLVLRMNSMSANILLVLQKNLHHLGWGQKKNNAQLLQPLDLKSCLQKKFRHFKLPWRFWCFRSAPSLCFKKETHEDGPFCWPHNMGVSENGGCFPSKSSILIGFSIINHPFWDTPILGNPHLGKLKKNSPTQIQINYIRPTFESFALGVHHIYIAWGTRRIVVDRLPKLSDTDLSWYFTLSNTVTISEKSEKMLTLCSI